MLLGALLATSLLAAPPSPSLATAPSPPGARSAPAQAERRDSLPESSAPPEDGKAGGGAPDSQRAATEAPGETPGETPTDSPAEPWPLVETPGARGADVPARLATRLELPLPDVKPLGLLSGDLDGDGKADLVAATESPGALYVWMDLGLALAEDTRPTVVRTGDHLIGPVWVPTPWAALSGESPLVAAASMASSEVYVVDLLSDPARRCVLRADPCATPRAIAAGDLGLDDEPDVCVLVDGPVRGTSELVVYGLAGERLRVPLADALPTCAHVLADGSGLVVGFQASRRLALLRNLDPAGARLAAPEWIELAGIPRDIVEADLDGDGDLELCVCGGDRELWTFGLGAPGGPTAWSVPRVAAPRVTEIGAIPLDLEATDLDHDGAAELVAVKFYDLNVSVLSRFDASGAPALHEREYAGQTPWDATVADFDGDGHADLAVSNRDAFRISLLFGADDVRFQSAPTADTGRSPQSAALADLDGDGDRDALVLSTLEDDLALLENEDGLLRHRGRVPTGAAAESVRAGDVDGDGAPDAAFLRRAPTGVELVVLFNDGAGGLHERPGSVLRVGDDLGDLLLADVDLDGEVEAIVADPGAGRVRILDRDGSGRGKAFRLREVATVRVPTAPCTLALLPLTAGPLRAGTVGIAVGVRGARSGVAIVRVWTDGAGDWNPGELAFLATEAPALDVATGDLDGDGRSDVALLTAGETGLSPGRVWAWLVDHEHAWHLSATTTTSQRPYRLALGDLDGDRRADLVVSAQHGQHVNLWLARLAPPAAGAAPAPPHERLSLLRYADLGVGSGPLDVLVRDLDGDGRADVLVVNHFSDDVSVVLNRAP